MKKYAVITGASAGIGAEAAKIFANRGYYVFILARRLNKLQELVDQFKPSGDGKLFPVQCDVASDESVKNAFVQIAQIAPYIDVLVNNAGYGLYSSCEKTSIADFEANMQTNYLGSIRCTQSALPKLRKAVENQHNTKPSIIMISSFVGKRSLPCMSAYCASKFALEAFSESLRVELKDSGISVSVINPGVTKTEFFDIAGANRPKQYLAPDRGMSPRQVAQVIFNASQRPVRNKYLTFSGNMGIIAQWLSPRFMDFIMLTVHRKGVE